MQFESNERSFAAELNLGLVVLPEPKALVHPDSIRPCGEIVK
jgi:hypothetical protein